jgi:hypothetical protein
MQRSEPHSIVWLSSYCWGDLGPFDPRWNGRHFLSDAQAECVDAVVTDNCITNEPFGR